MAKFKVTAVSRIYQEMTIEAPDLKTAQEIASNGDLDFENFREQTDGADFEIFWADTYEIKE